MKVIRKILYVLVFLIALLSIFIIVCAFNPDITKKIGTLLYQEEDLTVAADAGSDPGNNFEAQDTVYLPQIGNDEVQDEDAENDSSNADVRRENIRNDNPAGSSTSTRSPAGSSTSARSSARDDTASAGLRSDAAADYIAPDEAEIVVPNNVSGRSGYRQIEGDAQQIDDDAVGDVQNQLDFGHLGDGLQFDPLYYPYYNMLDDTGKRVYRQIYANANEVYPAFMPVDYVTSAQLRNIFAAVYNDHPELFWLETAYSCKYIRSGQCVEIDLQFNRTAQELNSARTAFNEQAGGIIAEAQKFSDNYTKEKYVHDQLLERISYNARAEMNQSAYSALVNGQTVCAGYARAFQYILQQLGIPCYYCTGYAGESHAWNIVQLSDGFYNVDTTWDDSDGGNYDYFNKTDEDYSNSHLRQELSVYLPPCNGQIYRNLERSGKTGDDNSQTNLRSLADVGITEDQVFTDVGNYYEYCYNQVVQNGVGHYTFRNAVADLGMAEELIRNYSSGVCWDTYLQNATNALDASYCVWYVTAEELEDGSYLLTHEIRMTK